ncbi:MAG: hypothetical protein WAZ77_17325 [Candidatus Nitrosopolaris sp.]
MQSNSEIIGPSGAGDFHSTIIFCPYNDPFKLMAPDAHHSTAGAWRCLH